MKDPNNPNQWLVALYLYWLFQLLLIVIAAAAVILIATAVIGQTSILEVWEVMWKMIDV
jgi:hypothetical protein